MSESPPEQPETWELLNDEMRHRIDVQRAAAERIEAKAAIVLGVSLALLQFVAKEEVDSGWLPWAIGAYAGSALFAVIVVLPRAVQEVNPRDLIVGLWGRSRGRASAELVNNRYVAYRVNGKRQWRRVIALDVSAVLLVLGAIMSSLHLARGERSDGERDGAHGATPTASVFYA